MRSSVRRPNAAASSASMRSASASGSVQTIELTCSPVRRACTAATPAGPSAGSVASGVLVRALARDVGDDAALRVVVAIGARCRPVARTRRVGTIGGEDQRAHRSGTPLVAGARARPRRPVRALRRASGQCTRTPAPGRAFHRRSTSRACSTIQPSSRAAERVGIEGEFAAAGRIPHAHARDTVARARRARRARHRGRRAARRCRARRRTRAGRRCRRGDQRGGSRASTSATSQAVARERERRGRADDAGADDDRRRDDRAGSCAAPRHSAGTSPR